MTQEEKKLLLQDLCARLSYGVKVRYSSYIEFITCTLHSINPIYNIVDLWSKDACFFSVSISKIKPYLRPMSSMTEEEHQELSRLVNDDKLLTGDPGKTICLHCGVVIDFFNSHHLDWRGLIPMGLALESKEGMYKTE